MDKERIVFLDVETTGLDPIRGGHRIIDISCIEYIGGQPTGMVITSLINPDGKRITKQAFEVHGISNSQVASQLSDDNYGDRSATTILAG